MSQRQGLTMVVCFCLLLAATASAQDEALTAMPEDPSAQTIIMFPQGDLYPQYTADPHRLGFGIQWLSFSKTEIAESSNSRMSLKAGGRFGLLRIHPPGQADRGWQLGIEGGFDTQFDIKHSSDNIGWDGNYGLLVTAAPSRSLALKFGVLHTSGHVGDEYAERTGRRRIDYTRHELAAGMSWTINERWRTYAEAGWGYYLRNEDLQEPGRIQFGLEFEVAASLWKRRLGWYVALDTSAMEERDWNFDTAVQLGLVFRSGCRVWRLGIEHYDGRPTMSEFFQDDERHIALGFWLDV